MADNQYAWFPGDDSTVTQNVLTELYNQYVKNPFRELMSFDPTGVSSSSSTPKTPKTPGTSSATSQTYGKRPGVGYTAEEGANANTYHPSDFGLGGDGSASTQMTSADWSSPWDIPTTQTYLRNPDLGVIRLFEDLGYTFNPANPYMRMMQSIADGIPLLFQVYGGTNGTGVPDVENYYDYFRNFYDVIQGQGGDRGLVPTDWAGAQAFFRNILSGENQFLRDLLGGSDPNAISDLLNSALTTVGFTAMTPIMVEALRNRIDADLARYYTYLPDISDGRDGAGAFYDWLRDNSGLGDFFGGF